MKCGQCGSLGYFVFCPGCKCYMACPDCGLCERCVMREQGDREDEG